MMYDGEVVMIAMAATALLVIALTLFAFQVLSPLILITYSINIRTQSNLLYIHLTYSISNELFQTKIDFTMCGGILFCVLFVFVLFGLLMAILPLMGVNIELLHLVYCGIGVLIFSIYLIYDTQVRSFLCVYKFALMIALISKRSGQF